MTRDARGKTVRCGGLVRAVAAAGVWLLLPGAACLIDAEQPDLRGKDVHLTILHTSDIHSRLLPYKYVPLSTDEDLGLDPERGPFGGIARISHIIRGERKKADRSIYLDSGDVFQGAPIFNMFKGEVEFRVMAQLRPDAMVVGNHEFDLGVRTLQDQFLTWGNFPLLAANYVVDVGPTQKSKLYEFLHGAQIINVKGLRVGIIGMGDIGSMYSLGEGGNSTGMTPLDLHQTLTNQIGQIRGSVDLVVVLSHLGLSEDIDIIEGYDTWFPRESVPEGYTILADTEPIDPTRPDVPLKEESDLGSLVSPEGWVKVKVPGVRGVDVIMGGHLHIVTDPPKVLRDVDGREVLIVHDGAFAKFVGRLDLVVHVPKDAADSRGVKGHHHTVFPIESTVPEDGEMLNFVEPYATTMNTQMNLDRPIAFAMKKIRRFNTGGGDSELGNLLADAMRIRKRVEAEFALTNSLGIRTDFEAGVLDVEAMYNVFPFENTLTTMFLSGKEVKELLDYATSRSAGRGCKSQVQVSGVSFVMNCATGEAQAISIGGRGIGRPLNPAESADCNQGNCSGCCDAGGACRDGDLDEQCGGGGTVCLDCRTESEVCSVDQKCRRPWNPEASYKLATNDYIAGGGSGFLMLKRNTTKFNTGISLRDTLADFMQTLPECGEDDFDPANFGGDAKSADELKSEYRDTAAKRGPMPCITPQTAREEGRMTVKTTD
ncbi:MAG: bifunctional metallophosphatase/5'-nucleotidase [Deltaproteobacteria bacterium]|nr:bifunctional metallophosphatase/5'-nucleotidase [Deltaproteobacteria bacterium]